MEWLSISLDLHVQAKHAPIPHAIFSSNERKHSILFSAAYFFTALSIGVGPQASILFALNLFSLIASNTLPFVPMLPSSAAIYTFPWFSSSFARKILLSLNPSTMIFSPSNCFAVSSIGGIPIPPPMRIVDLESVGKPFPRGPKTLISSPVFKFENSFVPAFSPVTLYTSLIESLLTSQILIGLGKSFEGSFVYTFTNCPGFVVFAISVFIQIE